MAQGFKNDPRVPQTGWRAEGLEDFDGRNEICERCARPLRFAHVMSHPGWPDLVRVGGDCAVRMGDPYAGQREQEFQRNPVNWRTQELANGTLIESERPTGWDLWDRPTSPAVAGENLFPSGPAFPSGPSLLQQAWAVSRQNQWLQAIIWFLIFALYFSTWP